MHKLYILLYGTPKNPLLLETPGEEEERQQGKEREEPRRRTKRQEQDTGLSTLNNSNKYTSNYYLVWLTASVNF